MAIYLTRTNTLILEVPKTGSKWVRAAIRRARIPHEQIGPDEWRGHAPLSVHGRDYSFIATFVRNPITWYQSYWAYRMEGGWRPHFELDRRCQSDSFVQFLRNAAFHMPGFLNRVFETYVGPLNAQIDFVGKQETLGPDLVRALRAAGEEFDEQAILDTPKANTTAIKPEYPRELKELITYSEYKTMRRFGYTGEFADPVRLGELTDRFPEHTDNFLSLAITTDSIHWTTDDAKATSGRPIRPGRRHARILTNFGLYVESFIRDMDLAESLIHSALAAEPAHPRTLGTLAAYLQNHKHQYDQAEAYYQRALEVRRDHVENLANYAVFRSTIRSDQDGAEALYREALAVNSENPRVLGNFALFLQHVRKRNNEAESFFKRAIETAPGDDRNAHAYSQFLRTIKNDDAGAEKVLLRANAARKALARPDENQSPFSPGERCANEPVIL